MTHSISSYPYSVVRNLCPCHTQLRRQEVSLPAALSQVMVLLWERKDSGIPNLPSLLLQKLCSRHPWRTKERKPRRTLQRSKSTLGSGRLCTCARLAVHTMQQSEQDTGHRESIPQTSYRLIKTECKKPHWHRSLNYIFVETLTPGQLLSQAQK